MSIGKSGARVREAQGAMLAEAKLMM